MEGTHTPIGKDRYPNDFTIRLIGSVFGAHIVAEFGGDGSWLQHLLTRKYYKEFGSTLIITLLLVEYIYRITCYLDKKADWHKAPVLRTGLQLLLGVLAPTLGAFLMAALYFGLHGKNIIDYNYHIYALPFIALLITLFNVYYYVRYLLAERAYYKGIRPAVQETDVAIAAPWTVAENKGNAVFMVHTVTKSFPIDTTDIAYFYRDANHVFLRPFDGEDFLLNQSLDQIENELGNSDFFRVARHVLISHSSLVDYRPLNFGKLAVTLNPPFREAVTASKPLARSFRQWVANPGGQ
jgi:hypothetical protein